MLEGKYTKGNGVNMRIMRPEALLSRMAKRIERDSFSRENPLAFFIFLLGPKEMWRAKVCLLVATVTLGGTISIGTAVETPSKGPTFGMPVPVILSLKSYCDIGSVAGECICAGNVCHTDPDKAVAMAQIMVYRGGNKVMSVSDKDEDEDKGGCDFSWPNAPTAQCQLIVPPPFGNVATVWQTIASSSVRGKCCGQEIGQEIEQGIPCDWLPTIEPVKEWGIIRGVTDCQNNPNAVFNPETCECEDLSGKRGGSPALSLPGPGGVSFRTRYDSQWGQMGPLGRGWTHSYDMVVWRTEYTKVSYGNKTYYYNWLVLENGSNQTGIGYHYEGNGNPYDTFVPNGPWAGAEQGIDSNQKLAYILRKKTGETYVFWEHNDPVDPDIENPIVVGVSPVKRYEIREIRDRDGRLLIEFEYRETADAMDELARVRDVANGRVINLVDLNGDGLVDLMSYPQEDPRALDPQASCVEGNEEWRFIRDSQYRLTQIVMPGGIEENFQYQETYPIWWPEDFAQDWTDNLILKQDARGVGTMCSYEETRDELSGRVSLTGRMPWTRERIKLGESIPDSETVFWNYRNGQAVSCSSKLRTRYSPRIGISQSAMGNLAYVITSETTQWRDEEKGTATFEWNGETVTGFTRTQRYDYGWDYGPWLANSGATVAQSLRTDWLTCAQDSLGRKTIYTYWDDPETAQYGSLKRTLTPDGVKTYQEYNNFNLPTVRVFDEGQTNLTTVNEYSAEGKLTRTLVPFGDSETEYSMVEYLYTPDGDMREIRSALWLASDPTVRTQELMYYGSSETGGAKRDLKKTTTRVRLDWDDPNPAIEEMYALYTYDTLGRIDSVQDTLGRITEFEFDDAGRRSKMIFPPAAPHGPRPQVGYGYDESGNMTTVTDPLGHATTFQYGLDNELEWVEMPLDETRRARTSYSYSDQLELTQVQDAEGSTTGYGFDNLGRLVSVTDALGQDTRFVFDEADRLTEHIDARGKHTFLEYDPVTDRLTRQTFEDESLEFAYNRLGRRESVSHTDSSGVTRDVEKVEYYRDGSVKTVNDCCGRVHGYTHLKDGSVNTHNFSRDGGITTEWLHQHTYDELGRPIQMVRTPGGVPGAPGEQGVKTWYNLSGTIKEIEYPNGSLTTFLYDGLDRVILMVNYGPDKMTLLSSFEYEYDLASRRTKIIRKDGTYTSFGYNHTGWLTRESRYDGKGTEGKEDDELLWQDEYIYDLVGNRTKKYHTETLPDGSLEITVHCYEYNVGNQLVLEYKKRGTLGKGTVIGQVWDDESGVASVTLNASAASVWGDMFYGEATARQGRYVEVVAEDRVGNQTRVTVEVDTSLSDFVSYRYDENGNLKEKMSVEGRVQYVWDHRNRLTKVIHPDGQETGYEYCHSCSLGKLSKMTRRDGSTVEWVWDGYAMIEEVDSRDAMATEYFGGLAVKRNGFWYYLHMDAMGSVYQVTDENGYVVNEFSWDAWGNELSGTFQTDTAVCSLGWQSKRFDEEQNVFYSVARWYDQRIGRFTQVDPAEGAGIVTTGGEGYGWPGRDPVFFLDPNGMYTVSEDLRRRLPEVNRYLDELIDDLKKNCECRQMLDEARKIGIGGRTLIDDPVKLLESVELKIDFDRKRGRIPPGPGETIGHYDCTNTTIYVTEASLPVSGPGSGFKHVILHELLHAAKKDVLNVRAETGMDEAVSKCYPKPWVGYYTTGTIR